MVSAVSDLLERGFNRELGFVIKQWQEDHSQLELTLTDKVLNRSDILHGGVISTLLDVAGGLAGCYCTVEGNVRRAVTLSLNIQYIDSVSTGVVLANARRRGGGYSIYFADAELVDEQGNLLATAQGTYKYIKGSEELTGTRLTT